MLEVSGKNFEGLNLTSPTKPYNNKSENSNIPHFDTVTYTSKNDGRTYIAKKLTLIQGDKKVSGIYVSDKNAKPDKNGNINGEFMSYDTFMKKMADELPTVNSQLMGTYYPNINRSQGQPVDLESQFYLDELINNSVSFKNGETILQRHCEGTINNISYSDSEDKYILKSRPVVMDSEWSTSIITEDELKQDKYLCAGTIKKIGDNKYKVVYIPETGNSSEKQEELVLSASDCLKFLEEKILSPYSM